MAIGKTIKTITDYLNDGTRVSPADRERINFLQPLDYRIEIVPLQGKKTNMEA